MGRKRRSLIALAVISSILVVIGIGLMALAVRDTLSRAVTNPTPGQANMPGPAPAPGFGQSPLDPVATFIASLIPTPGPPPPPTPVPPPTPPVSTPFPHNPNFTPNIAWGVETSDNLAIWVGSYSDAPTPKISNAQPAVQWKLPQAFPIRLFDLAVSPDHRSLAVLGAKPMAQADGSSTAGWLSVVDLENNRVQTIPDYGHYQLYQEFGYAPPIHVLGWVDNDRIAVEGTDLTRTATKDGASSATVWAPGRWVYSGLASDRKTIFSFLDGDNHFYVHSIDGSNERTLVNTQSARPLDYPNWSPDGTHVAFLASDDSDTNTSPWHMGLWLFDVGTDSQVEISSADVWDIDPAWSDDSSRIAFLRADDPVTNLTAWWTPENVETNIYTARMSNLAPQRLTTFKNVKNRGLQWTPGGNLILSSTLGSPGDLPRLIAVSTKDGASTTLLVGSPGESLTHPLIFK